MPSWGTEPTNFAVSPPLPPRLLQSENQKVVIPEEWEVNALRTEPVYPQLLEIPSTFQKTSSNYFNFSISRH